MYRLTQSNTFLSLTPQVLGITEKEFFDQMGVHFVGFVGQYGYDRVLSVLGRHVRDFLNGLDNLHEYLKFSYPRMRAPSFICENETRQGEWIFQASSPFYFHLTFSSPFFSRTARSWSVRTIAEIIRFLYRNMFWTEWI